MGRAAAKREILRAITRLNAEWYWYQIDRVLSGLGPDSIGPFTAEINELAAEGLIEIRPSQECREECGIGSPKPDGARRNEQCFVSGTIPKPCYFAAFASFC